MGFLRALFDFSFSQFVTTRLIRFLYAIGVLVAALTAVSAIIAGFNESGGAGLAALIFSPILFLPIVIIARVYLEIVIVVFRIAEYLRDMSGADHVRDLVDYHLAAAKDGRLSGRLQNLPDSDRPLGLGLLITGDSADSRLVADRLKDLADKDVVQIRHQAIGLSGLRGVDDLHRRRCRFLRLWSLGPRGHRLRRLAHLPL